VKKAADDDDGANHGAVVELIVTGRATAIED